MRGQIEQDLLDLRKAQAHGTTMQCAMRGQLGLACPAMQTHGRYQRQNARVFLRQYVKHAVQRQAENSVAQAAAVEEKQQANPASHHTLKVLLYFDI